MTERSASYESAFYGRDVESIILKWKELEAQGLGSIYVYLYHIGCEEAPVISIPHCEFDINRLVFECPECEQEVHSNEWMFDFIYTGESDGK